MKNLLKYITLLIFSGVIIPLYQPAGNSSKAKQIRNSAMAAVDSSAQHDSAFHLYFIHDVVAKLLPIADFLNNL